MGVILDGKAIAQSVRQTVKEEVTCFRDRYGLAPGLATVLIGENAASRVYVRTKEKACEKVGIQSFAYRLPETVALAEVLALIAELNARPEVHGVLIQLPLPQHLEPKRLVEALNPDKDVDGLHPINQGKLFGGEEGLRPCTPLGVMHLLDQTGISLAGKKAVVIGRSTLVGRPLLFMLLEQDATVTGCHSRTVDLKQEIQTADIVIPAIGQPGAIPGAWIKDGAIVIDVGISRVADGSLTGDVEFVAAKERAAFITPVPGGVGPMTVAMLLKNTVKAAKRQKQGMSSEGEE
jgi:methylenetetrahydrofolate dehydrogenase (NADP+)/methenyltetrahydrofolate cyclohydrolase